MTEKALVNKLRRLADRYGLRLEKSRDRNPDNSTFGGYHLIDLECGGVVFGWDSFTGCFGASLEEIAEFLTDTSA